MRFHVKSRHRFSFNGSKFMYFFVLRKYFHHVFVLNKRPFVYYYPKKYISIIHGHHKYAVLSIEQDRILFCLIRSCAKQKADFRKEPLSRKANYALPP